jgi:hypothetical protein
MSLLVDTRRPLFLLDAAGQPLPKTYKFISVNNTKMSNAEVREYLYASQYNFNITFKVTVARHFRPSVFSLINPPWVTG